MPNQQPALIFDLDGTLTDSKPGIVACLRKVLDARNLSSKGDLARFVGPPVEEWTRELLPDGSDEERLQLGREYRACYDREGWNNNSVFPGVRAMLEDLHARGVRLFVCTSKQQHFADRILNVFDLARFFAAVYGDKASYVDHSKANLLARLLREQDLAPATSWMVGDRIFDLQAAQANHVRCVAAGWGYGDSGELVRADALAATPADVVAHMLLPVGGFRT